MIFGYILLLIIIFRLIYVLVSFYLDERVVNYLFLGVGFLSVAIGTIFRIVSFSVEDTSVYDRIFNASSVVLMTAILIILIRVLLNRKRGIKIVWGFLLFAFFTMFVSGGLLGGQFDGAIRQWFSIVVAIIVLILTLIVIYRTRQKGALYFLIAMLVMSVGGMLGNEGNYEVLFVGTMIAGCLLLALGIGNFQGDSLKNKKNKESIFGNNIIAFKSIRSKLMVPIIFAVLIMTISVAFFVFSVSEDLLLSEINRHLLTASQSRARHVVSFLEEQKDKISIAAVSHEIENMLEAHNNENYTPEHIDEHEGLSETIHDEISDELEQIIATNKEFYEIFVLDIRGIVHTSTNMDNTGLDRSTDDYFVNAQAEPFIKDAYNSTTTSEKTFTTSAPIFNDLTGDFLGVIVARIDMDNLDEIMIERTGWGNTGETYLVNNDYLMITPSRFIGDTFLVQEVDTVNSKNCFSMRDSSLERTGIDPEIQNGYIVANHISHYATSIFDDYRGVTVIGTHVYLPEMDWCLLAEIDEKEAFIPIQNMQRSVVYGSMIFLFVVVMVVYLLSRMIAKPIKALHEGTEIIEKGDLDYKVGTNSMDEIGVLSRSFDKMTQAFKKSKDDIENKVIEQTSEIQVQKDKLELQRSAVLNILEDVEQEKEKADVLAQDLEKFQLAVANASDHIVITDADGIVVYANKAVETITGFTISEVVGKKAGVKELWGGLMSKEFYKKFWDTIKNKKKVFSGLVNNVRKNGEKYIAFGSVSPVLDDAGKVQFFIGIERDVTKEQEVDKAKTEFVSLASHQLRTPLSTINWYSEMLLDEDVGKLTKEQKEYIKEIYDGNQRMVDLVNALLNVSRIDLGTMAIEPEIIQLTEISDSVIKEMKLDIVKKKMILKKDYGKSVPKINADRKLSRIILQNLISNAIKYTPEKGKITVTIKKKKDDLFISVADNGYGIPDNQKDKMFVKLFRADNIRKTDTEGTGLGLYIVKSIVEQSGGDISFVSKEGEGTTFNVTLPLKGMSSKEGSKGLEFTS